MNDVTKEYVISFYNRTLEMHGDRAEAVGWTASGQMRHFECLLEIAPSIEGKKILDYGCGKGDFYHFLKERDIAVDYTGFDINSRLIDLAKRKYPECRFAVFDIEKDLLTEDFDFIFLCGVFNMKVEGLYEVIIRTLAGLFAHCNKGLAFNALSAHNPEKAFELNYVYPEEMAVFAARNLSPYISLKQDRIPHDFTLFVYKEEQDWDGQ